jgi:hypothetical protein
MKFFLVLAFTLISIFTFGNINQIDVLKISNDVKVVAVFDEIKANQKYYDHWYANWEFSTSRRELIDKLRGHYLILTSLPSKNEELDLLLGDVAHYLYNLNEASYFQEAEKHYKDAFGRDSASYRALWFLGNHYALSNLPVKAIEHYKKAVTLLPAKVSSDFWNEYAMALYGADMPSSAIYAMEKAREILGTSASFELHLGEEIKKRQLESDALQGYKIAGLWQARQHDKIAFISKPLGIKLWVDKKWRVQPTDFANRQSAFIINPPSLKNSKGMKIDYTIGILMKAADSSETLKSYVDKLARDHPANSNVSLTNKYDKTVAYEIRNPEEYKHMGGGRFYILGIERNAPAFPGLLLEEPTVISNDKGEQVKYLRPSSFIKRFPGRIFYAILLDTCEDIHAESLAIFTQLLNTDMLIE